MEDRDQYHRELELMALSLWRCNPVASSCTLNPVCYLEEVAKDYSIARYIMKLLTLIKLKLHEKMDLHE